MFKEKKNKIEKIINVLFLNNGLNYSIKYKDIKIPKLVNEKDLTELEKKHCEIFKKSLLNKKRLSMNNNSSNNTNSLKNIMEKYNKENKNSSNKNEKKTKCYERKGDLLVDSPLKILNVGKFKNDNSLHCLVKWKQSNGIRILDSLVEAKKMKTTNPKLLIDYYESKIIFLDDL